MSGQAIVKINDKQWFVSVATTYSELAAGLGGVPSIPAGTGMLFDLGHDQHITITSEGMLFPIDTAFISSSLTVVEIVQDLVTGSPHEVTSSVPARFFLEVNAGEMDDIDLGDPVMIQGYTPQVVRPLWFWQAVQIMVVVGLLALQSRAIWKQVTEPEASHSSSHSSSRRGEPKTESERRETHLARYGTEQTPPRGARFER